MISSIIWHCLFADSSQLLNKFLNIQVIVLFFDKINMRDFLVWALWENRLISITKKSEIISSTFERKAAARSLFDNKYKANQGLFLQIYFYSND